MSSASGLAAAKRRRVGNDFSLDNTITNGNTNNRIRVQDLVISHERRIQDIEKIFTEDKLDFTDNDFKVELSEKLENLEKKIVPNVNDKDDIEYYKKKLNIMEDQIKELKKTMVSIQNIAVDTNTNFMEYKNNVKK